MSVRRLTLQQLDAYSAFLRQEERSPGTREKYRRDIKAFYLWVDGRNVTKETVIEWKEHLVNEEYAPVTINSMLAALNGLFGFLEWGDCRVKFLKVQRRMFREEKRELTREEYNRLLEAARNQGRERLALVMETICTTGIRVSEVQYITMEAVRRGRAEITLKGKIRVIFLPVKLCRKLAKYSKKQKIVSGEIFLTGNGKPLNRRQIWAEMKGVCKYADVTPSKVYPHNLRHLFATVFYKMYKDISRLADLLGHSSIETTRIYLTISSAEHACQLERLGLVT